MGRIKINDLPKDMVIGVDEMKRVSGGAHLSHSLFKSRPLLIQPMADKWLKDELVSGMVKILT